MPLQNAPLNSPAVPKRARFPLRPASIEQLDSATQLGLGIRIEQRLPALGRIAWVTSPSAA